METTPQSSAAPILVGIDGSPLSDAALLWAAAQAERARTALHVTHVAAPTPAPTVGVFDVGRPEEVAGPIAEKAVSQARAAHPDLPVISQVLVGKAAPALIEASKEATMVVLGARGRGRVSGLFVGSVSQQVAMHAACPVVVVRGSGRPDKGPVVVGTDGSGESTQALRFALRHADAVGSSVRVVHAEYVEPAAGVWPGSWYGKLLEDAGEWTTAVRAAVDDVAREFPDVDVDFRAAQYHPAEALVEESTDASLLVVGSRGLGGFSGLMLGSVSQGVLSQATVPVAIVPPADGKRGEPGDGSGSEEGSERPA